MTPTTPPNPDDHPVINVIVLVVLAAPFVFDFGQRVSHWWWDLRQRRLARRPAAFEVLGVDYRAADVPIPRWKGSKGSLANDALEENHLGRDPGVRDDLSGS
jgi:hypothetical protein